MVIGYGKQSIDQGDIDAVTKVLKSDFLTQGPSVSHFEEDFSREMGSKFAVSVSNATAALHLSCKAIGLEKNQKVITSPLTFAASANCVLYCGGLVDLCDIDPVTYTMDLSKLEEKLKRSPKGTYAGVIPVSYAGHPIDGERLKYLAKEYNFWVIEDNCHAPGSSFRDQAGTINKTGSCKYADLSVFSLHPVKHIAAGEGGVITTNNKSLYEKLKLLRSHNMEKSKDSLWEYDIESLGYNYRLTDIQASLATTQLKKLKDSVRRRNEIARFYNEQLKFFPLVLPKAREGFFHAYHLYAVQAEKRKELYLFLRERKIYTQVHYIPIHYLSLYKKKGFKQGMYPIAESFYEKCLSLPMFPTLEVKDLKRIISYIKEFYENKKNWNYNPSEDGKFEASGQNL